MNTTRSLIRSTVIGALAGVALTPALAAPASQTFLPAPSVVATDPGQPATAARSDDASPPASEQWLEQQTAKVRADVEARVARGDMTPDEAERLIGWRHWQLSQEAAGIAPQPMIAQPAQAPVNGGPYYAPAPYYAVPYTAPMYRSYYYNPYYAPGYGVGLSICAGGAGRNGALSVCF